MKRFLIGFNTGGTDEPTPAAPPEPAAVTPRESLVDVYFPSRGRTWTYYNDLFDLHEGDVVYVDGKLEGKQGRIVKVNYSFKIKLSDYKRVIAAADTSVKGEFYFADSHIITFDKNALPYEKVLPWFKAPDTDAEYAVGTEDESFPLDDLTKMNISPMEASDGRGYFYDGKVVYISLDGTKGRAVVEGSRFYEIEFEYIEGEIHNLTCSCYCNGACSHGFAAMLQLDAILKKINENYQDEYGDYFAAIYKGTFMSCAVNAKDTGKITID